MKSSKINYIIVIFFIIYFCIPIQEPKISLKMTFDHNNCKRELFFKLNTIIVDHSEELRIRNNSLEDDKT